jgi:hypothetical protein
LKGEFVEITDIKSNSSIVKNTKYQTWTKENQLIPYGHMVMNMMKDVVDIVNFACVIAIPKVAPSH